MENPMENFMAIRHLNVRDYSTSEDNFSHQLLYYSNCLHNSWQISPSPIPSIPLPVSSNKSKEAKVVAYSFRLVDIFNEC